MTNFNLSTYSSKLALPKLGTKDCRQPNISAQLFFPCAVLFRAQWLPTVILHSDFYLQMTDSLIKYWKKRKKTKRREAWIKKLQVAAMHIFLDWESVVEVCHRLSGFWMSERTVLVNTGMTWRGWTCQLRSSVRDKHPWSLSPSILDFPAKTRKLHRDLPCWLNALSYLACKL